MKRILWFSLFVIVLLTMAACSSDKEVVVEEVEELLPIEVVLTVPESADVEEKVNMEAIVTQGDENVEDADKVVFEVWEEGKKTEGQMIDAINEKEGLYTAETSFTNDGLFNIQVHVDARGLHTMPKDTVIVGDGGHEEIAEENGDYEHHTEGFNMKFTIPETVEVDQEEALVVELKIGNELFENAKVRYEIWKHSNPDKHDWVNAEESAPGEYTAPYIFTEVDTFTIVIHVEDDEELHEHEEHVIEVK